MEIYTPDMFNEIPLDYCIKGMKFFYRTKIPETDLYSNLIVVEKQPIKRTIYSLLDVHFEDVVPNFLLIPNTLYFLCFKMIRPNYFSFCDLGVAFSNKQIISGDDVIYSPPLSNVYGLSVCMEKMHPSCHVASTLQELFNKTVSYFWQSAFKEIKFLEQWQKFTKNELLEEFAELTKRQQLISDVFPCLKNIKAFTDEQSENTLKSTGS